MAFRSAKDGEPYFCETCGASPNGNCAYGSGYCRMESREIAQKRKVEWERLEAKRKEVKA